MGKKGVGVGVGGLWTLLGGLRVGVGGGGGGGGKQRLEGNNTHLKGLQRCVSVCMCVCVIPGDKSVMSYRSPTLSHTHTHRKKVL